MVRQIRKNFNQFCGLKPKHILRYRDGILESQFQEAMDYKVAAVYAGCAALKIHKPKLTFVVVQKHQHARFFSMEQRDADRTENCLPGTIIDTEIAHPFEFDLYLQSHPRLQGTSFHPPPVLG